MKINKISSSSMLALAVGALLTSFPAIAETITFTTGPDATNIGSSTGNDSNFLGADISTAFDPTTNGGTLFDSNGLSDSFGMLAFKGAKPNGSVISVDVTPSINGGAASPSINFSGVAVNGIITFSGSGTEMISGNQYVYQVANGVQYAIEQNVTLPTSVTKATYIMGFVGVPLSITPEPATVATTGLALVLAGLIARRKATAKN